MQYQKAFKKKIIRLHLEDERTIQSLSTEYGVSKSAISIWLKAYREESRLSQESKKEYDYMKKNQELQKQLEEMRKENEFLKNAAIYFAKAIDKSV